MQRTFVGGRDWWTLVAWALHLTVFPAARLVMLDDPEDRKRLQAGEDLTIAIESEAALDNLDWKRMLAAIADASASVSAAISYGLALKAIDDALATRGVARDSRFQTDLERERSQDLEITAVAFPYDLYLGERPVTSFSEHQRALWDLAWSFLPPITDFANAHWSLKAVFGFNLDRSRKLPRDDWMQLALALSKSSEANDWCLTTSRVGESFVQTVTEQCEIRRIHSRKVAVCFAPNKFQHFIAVEGAASRLLENWARMQRASCLIVSANNSQFVAPLDEAGSKIIEALSIRDSFTYIGQLENLLQTVGWVWRQESNRSSDN